MLDTMTVIGGQLVLFSGVSFGASFLTSAPSVNKFLPKVVLWMMLGPIIATLYPDYFSPETRLAINWIGFFAVQSFGYTTGMHLNVAELISHGWKVGLLGITSFAFAAYLGFEFCGYDAVQLKVFCALASGITALPVLSAILNLIGIIHTPLARINIGMAMVHDVIAWISMLAIFSTDSGHGAAAVDPLMNGALILCYIGAMVFIVRPTLVWLEQFVSTEAAIRGLIPARFFVALPFLVASCFASHALHLHALLGAVMCGVILPDTYKRASIWIEPITLHWGLPFFVVGAGLGISLTTLGPGVWELFWRLLAANITGQLIGTLLIAFILGYSLPIACAITSFMLSKGIMELVFAKIMYDAGRIPFDTYAAVVMLAIVLTLACAPIAHVALAFARRKGEDKLLEGQPEFALAGSH